MRQKKAAPIANLSGMMRSASLADRDLIVPRLLESSLGAMTTAPPAPAADAVLTFLSSVARPTEAQLYLELFRKLPKEAFAVIAPGLPVVRQGVGGFVEQVRFLGELGLFAPVVLGLFDSPTGVVTERLMRRFESAHVSTSLHSAHEPGLTETLRRELCAGVVPVVELGAAPDGGHLPWLGTLTTALGTRKVVLVRRRGGLSLQGERRLVMAERHQLPLDGTTVSLVNLRTDAEVLRRSLLGKLDAGLLDAASRLISIQERLAVSVTSPLDLLRELFTIRGAGTLIKCGSAVERYESYAELHTGRLTSLFETSFGHGLDADYFSRAPRLVLLEQEYRGAAVVHDAPVAPYLSKFAVEPLARGEGLGRDLWSALTREFPRFFWRTRADNSAQSWYSQVCDGFSRGSRWHVYWRGLSPESIPEVIHYADALPDDFARAAPIDRGSSVLRQR